MTASLYASPMSPGKGLPAALLMSNMQATLRALLGRTESLPELAGHASELLFGSTCRRST